MRFVAESVIPIAGPLIPTRVCAAGAPRQLTPLVGEPADLGVHAGKLRHCHEGRRHVPGGEGGLGHGHQTVEHRLELVEFPVEFPGDVRDPLLRRRLLARSAPDLSASVPGGVRSVSRAGQSVDEA
jgi:hypothetical protein